MKRRNTIPSAVILPTTTTTNNHHHSSPSPPSLSVSGVDFELISLRDILLPCSPSSILSPTPAASFHSGGGGSGYEISIRNRLVKQAAWAYLQPVVSPSPSSSSNRLFLFAGEFLRRVCAGVRRFFDETLIRVFDWFVDALWLILCR